MREKALRSMLFFGVKGSGNANIKQIISKTKKTENDG